MAYQLKIRYDGDVPGLAEHRLSLNAFGDPLRLLAAALRRIATQMVGSATEGEHPRTGRFANLARQLDIEIVQIVGNSSGADAIVTFYTPPDELALFADLPDRATLELLTAIERESSGQPSNSAVRSYLKSLPLGLHKQSYEFHNNGTMRRRVEIGDMKVTDLPSELPSFREVQGNVVGVGFEPGKSEVRLKSEFGTPIFDAAPEQVEVALSLRKAGVRVFGIQDGRRTRLLRIAPASEPRFEVSKEAIEEHIFKRWSGVFERLAK